MALSTKLVKIGTVIYNLDAFEGFVFIDDEMPSLTMYRRGRNASIGLKDSEAVHLWGLICACACLEVDSSGKVFVPMYDISTRPRNLE